jgi:hypothetical protein
VKRWIEGHAHPLQHRAQASHDDGDLAIVETLLSGGAVDNEFVVRELGEIVGDIDVPDRRTRIRAEPAPRAWRRAIAPIEVAGRPESRRCRWG